MKKINFFQLSAFIIGSVLLGSLGSIFTAPNIPTWYRGLAKPVLSPPNFIFAPVWTTLFTLMGISSYLVFRGKSKSARRGLVIFGIQFFFNILWSFLFFGQRSPFAGLICIVILWSLILWNIIVFYKINKTSGLLLVPYLIWVSFATYLNYSIFILNK